MSTMTAPSLKRKLTWLKTARLFRETQEVNSEQIVQADDPPSY